MIYQFKEILVALFDAFSFKKTGFLRYILLTGLIGLILTSVLIYVIWNFSSYLGTFISAKVPWSWAHESLAFSIIVGIASVVIVFMIFKYVLLICLSPILSFLSESVEAKYHNRPMNSTFTFAASAARSVRVNLRNITKEMFMTIILFVVSFIPGAQIVTIPLLFIVQTYFIGFGFMDFYMERHLDFRESVSYVYQQKWAAILVGSIFILIMIIPIIGLFVGPYIATVMSSIYLSKSFNKERELLS